MVGFYCTGGRGTETFIAEELKLLNMTNILIEDGKVFFHGEPNDFEQICNLKSAERVFLQILHEETRKKPIEKSNHVRDAVLQKHLWFKDSYLFIFRKIQEKEFGSRSIAKKKSASHCHCGTKKDDSHNDNFEIIDEPPAKKICIEPNSMPSESFRVSFKCAGNIGLKVHSQLLAKQIGCKLKKWFKWSIDLRNPSLEISGHLNDDHLTVGIPLQRTPLSKRSYIQHFGLRSTVAWIMTNLLEIKSDDIVMDPMCGKGILIYSSFMYYCIYFECLYMYDIICMFYELS